MPRKSQKTTIEEGDMNADAVSKPKAKPTQVMPVKAPRKVTFDVWAQRKGVKVHHRGGLRAYVKNPNLPRTMDEWDKVFETY